MEIKKLDITYFPQKDILSMIILPPRPAVMGITDYGFLVGYNQDNEDEIVSFEILDFATYFMPHLHEPGVVPEMDLRFDVQVSEPVTEPGQEPYFKVVGTGPTNATLQEVLEWAYREFVLKRVPELSPQLVGA